MTKKIHSYGCPKYNNYYIVTPKIVEAIFRNKYEKGSSIGTQRYNKLALDGYDPDTVQVKVNWVINTAKTIKNGDPEAKKIRE